MLREIAQITRQDLEREAAQNSLPFFVTIGHPELNKTVRLVTDLVDYIYEGVLWNKALFELSLLTDTDKPPQTKFSFDNIDTDADRLFRTMRGPANVSFKIVSSAYFDKSKQPRILLPDANPVPVYHAQHLTLQNVTVTPETISGSLMNFDPRLEMWPSRRATEDLAPGVFLK